MKNNNKKIRVMFSGGGTGGSVAPLLAVYDKLDKDKFSFWWIGTKNGPEEEMIESKGIEYRYIHSGKLRRYFSWKNFYDPMFVFLGFLESFYFLLFRRQDIIITAGSFVSVPLVWAAFILRIPVIVHQQDIRPGLANKLMSGTAKVVTTVFEKSLKDYGKKAVWTGNPVRETLKTEKDSTYFDFNGLIPTVLVIGGGTGAKNLNQLVYDSLDNLSEKIQIIHVSGKGKIEKNIENQNYRQYEFLDELSLSKAYTQADIVVSRCGIGVLSELSFLKKTTILVPMPDSHQEDNAKVFEEAQAAVVLHESKLDKYSFIIAIENLLNNENKMKSLRENISKIIKDNSTEEFVKIIESSLILKANRFKRKKPILITFISFLIIFLIIMFLPRIFISEKGQWCFIDYHCTNLNCDSENNRLLENDVVQKEPLCVYGECECDSILNRINF